MQLRPSAIWAYFNHCEPKVVVVAAAAAVVVVIAVVVIFVVVVYWFWAQFALGCNCTGTQLHWDAINVGT